jgi:hypothetical protein
MRQNSVGRGKFSQAHRCICGGSREAVRPGLRLTRGRRSPRNLIHGPAWSQRVGVIIVHFPSAVTFRGLANRDGRHDAPEGNTSLKFPWTGYAQSPLTLGPVRKSNMTTVLCTGAGRRQIATKVNITAGGGGWAPWVPANQPQHCPSVGRRWRYTARWAQLTAGDQLS